MVSQSFYLWGEGVATPYLHIGAHAGVEDGPPGAVRVEQSSSPHAHPSTEDHDDTVEAHYACLEGWVFVGYIDEYGEEKEGRTAADVARTVCTDLRKKMGERRDDGPPFPLRQAIIKAQLPRKGIARLR